MELLLSNPRDYWRNLINIGYLIIFNTEVIQLKKADPSVLFPLKRPEFKSLFDTTRKIYPSP